LLKSKPSPPDIAFLASCAENVAAGFEFVKFEPSHDNTCPVAGLVTETSLNSLIACVFIEVTVPALPDVFPVTLPVKLPVKPVDVTLVNPVRVVEEAPKSIEVLPTVILRLLVLCLQLNLITLC
jgi:hypothetical protein